MCPFFKVLNGYFVKEWDDFPYFQFPEPWICNGKLTPGFEIFFVVEAERSDLEPIAIAEKEWEDNMDASLFEQVYMIGSEEEADPTKFIQPAVTQLNNWYQEEKLVLNFQSKSESSLMSNIESPNYPLLESVSNHHDAFVSLGLESVYETCKFNNTYLLLMCWCIRLFLLSLKTNKMSQ